MFIQHTSVLKKKKKLKCLKFEQKQKIPVEFRTRIIIIIEIPNRCQSNHRQSQLGSDVDFDRHHLGRVITRHLILEEDLGLASFLVFNGPRFVQDIVQRFQSRRFGDPLTRGAGKHAGDHFDVEPPVLGQLSQHNVPQQFRSDSYPRKSVGLKKKKKKRSGVDN